MNASHTVDATHDERARDRILDSAAVLFSRHGYGKTSMRFLAGEVRVSTSTIYSHFAGKSDLLVKVVDRRLGLLEAAVAAETQHGDDPLRMVTRSLEIINATIVNDTFLRKLLSFDPYVVDHRLHDRADLARERIRRLALDCLEAAIEQRGSDCKDAAALEAVLRLAFQGWVLSVEHGAREVPEDRFTAMLVRCVEAVLR